MATMGTIPKWFAETEDGWLLEPEGRNTLYQQAKNAGIGAGKLGRMRIDTFDTERDPQAYNLSMKWLNAHLHKAHPDDGGWLFLQGKNGRGKTHLAVSLLRLLIWANPCLQFGRGTAWTYYDAAGFYAPWARVTAGYEAWEQHEDDISKATVLVIDDLTKRRVTPWSLEILYDVVDKRDRDDQITIFTSNTALQDLFEWYIRQASKQDRDVVTQASLAIIGRIQQRIRHPDGAWLVTMTGRDYRTT